VVVKEGSVCGGCLAAWLGRACARAKVGRSLHAAASGPRPTAHGPPVGRFEPPNSPRRPHPFIAHAHGPCHYHGCCYYPLLVNAARLIASPLCCPPSETAPPRRRCAMAVEALSSNVVNYLVWRYLQEAGAPPQHLSPRRHGTPSANMAQATVMPRCISRAAGSATRRRCPSRRTSSRTRSSTCCRTACGSTSCRPRLPTCVHRPPISPSTRQDALTPPGRATLPLRSRPRPPLLGAQRHPPHPRPGHPRPRARRAGQWRCAGAAAQEGCPNEEQEGRQNERRRRAAP